MTTTTAPAPCSRRSSPAAAAFFRKAQTTPRLSAAEVKNLFLTRAEALRTGCEKQSEKLGKHLATSHLYLVAQVVGTYKGEVDYDELISAGSRGLLQAIDGYEPARGGAFSAYATRWVKQAVARAQYRSLRGSAPFNYRADKASRKLRALSAALSTELGYEPTERELAARSGQGEAEVRELLRAGQQTYSLQQPCRADSETTLEEALEDSAVGAVYGALNYRQTLETLLRNSRLFLTEKERYVLLSRLGLQGDGEPACFEDIAAVLGVSSARAKQLYNSACRTLRALPELRELHRDWCA